jgi:hypothetical protein
MKLRFNLKNLSAIVILFATSLPCFASELDDFVGEAKIEAAFTIFPASVQEGVKHLVSNPSDAKLYQALQNDLCNGKVPKFTPSMNVTYVYPKPIAGTALSEASKRQKEFTSVVRIYLQRWFLSHASNKENFGDLSNYEKLGAATIGALANNKQSEIVEWYKNLHDGPVIPPTWLGPLEWFPEHDLIVLVDPKDHSAVLSSKVVNLVTWVTRNGRTDTYVQDFNLGSPIALRPHGGTYNNLEKHAFFIPSEQAFRVHATRERSEEKDEKYQKIRVHDQEVEKDYNLHPLKLAYDSTLAFLRANYSFSKLKNRKLTSGESKDEREDLWDQFFALSTTVKEAPVDASVTKFTVSLNLASFCSGSLPRTSYEAQ